MAENTMQNETESNVDIDIARASGTNDSWKRVEKLLSWKTFEAVSKEEEERSTARRGYETRVTKLVTEFQIGCSATILPAYRGIPFWPKREDRLRIEPSSVQEVSPIDCNFVGQIRNFIIHIYIAIREIHFWKNTIRVLYYLKSNIYIKYGFLYSLFSSKSRHFDENFIIVKNVKNVILHF